MDSLVAVDAKISPLQWMQRTWKAWWQRTIRWGAACGLLGGPVAEDMDGWLFTDTERMSFHARARP